MSAYTSTAPHAAYSYIHGKNCHALWVCAKNSPLQTALAPLKAVYSVPKSAAVWSWKHLRSVDGFDEIASAVGIATAELAVFAAGTPLVIPGALGACEEYAETVSETRALIENVRAQNQALDQVHTDIHRMLALYVPEKSQYLNLLRFKVEDTPPKERNTTTYLRDKQRYFKALHSEIRLLKRHSQITDVSDACRYLIRQVKTSEVYQNDAVKALKENLHQVRTHWTGAVAMAGMGSSMLLGIAKTAWEVADKASLPVQMGTALSGAFLGSQVLMALYGGVRVHDGLKVHSELNRQARSIEKYSDSILFEQSSLETQYAFKLLEQDNKRRQAYNRYGGTWYGGVTAVGQSCMAFGTGLTLGTGGLGAVLAAPLFAVGVPLTLIGAAMRSTVEATFKRYTGDKEQEPDYARYDLPERDVPEPPKAKWGLSLRAVFRLKKKPSAWVQQNPTSSVIVNSTDPAPTETPIKSHRALRGEAVATIKGGAKELAESKLLSHVRHVIKQKDWSSLSFNQRCDAIIKRAEQSSALNFRGNRTTLLKQTRADVIDLARQIRETDHTSTVIKNLQEVIKKSDQTEAQEALLHSLTGDHAGQSAHDKAFEKLRDNQDYEVKFFKELEKKGKRQLCGGALGVLSRSILPNKFHQLNHKVLQKKTSADISIEDRTSATSQSSDSLVSSLSGNQSDQDIINARDEAYEYLRQNVSLQKSTDVHLRVSQACMKSLLRVGKREGKKKLQDGFGQMMLAQKMKAV
jgi:hypothetical protein